LKFESKYEVGQKLWEIRLREVMNTEKCECCGQAIYHHEWYLDEAEQVIHGVNITNGNVTYKVWRPCVYREYLSENEIGVIFFTSRKDALDEVEKLNNESKLS